MDACASLMGRLRVSVRILVLVIIPFVLMQEKSQAEDAVSSSKRIDYNVTFDNAAGSTDLTITHPKTYNAGFGCMYQAGPDLIVIKKGETKSFSITTSNSSQNNCFSSAKYVTWTTGDGGSNWAFTVKPIDGVWSEEVRTQFKTNPPSGVPSAATCGGQDCLNSWVRENADSPKLLVSFK
jgi:hypothetical protein